MPLRSVLDIDVNDQQFDRFFDKWKAYDEQRKQAAEDARDRAQEEKQRAEEAERARRSSFRGRVGAFFTEPVEIAKKRAPTEFENRLQGAAKEWEKMQNASRNVARSMEQIGSRALHLVGSLTKLTGLLSLVGGAATGFGFLGADVLGRTASGWRRNALGLGASIGGTRAFGLEFGRFVDPNTFLGGVAQAMRDPRHSVALAALGVTARPGEDTADVASRALERTQELAKQTPENLLGTLLQSRRLDQLGLNLGDLQRLRGMSREELHAQEGHFRQDREAFNLSPGQARGWQDFLTTLDRARMGIETTFIVRLSPLAPALGHLSEAFNKVISSLLSRPDFGKWIEQSAAGLEHLATYISSDAFQKDVETFGTKVGEMATAIGQFITWLVDALKDLHLIGGKPAEGTPGVDPAGRSLPEKPALFGSHFWQNPDGTIIDPDTGRFYTRKPDGTFEGTDRYAPGSYGDKRFVHPESEQPGVPYKAGDILRDMNITDAQYDAFKGSVASIEHARYDQMGGSGGNYAGRYQFGRREIEETAARLGEPAPTTQQFLNDPAMQERFFEAYTAGHNAQLLAKSAEYRALSPEKRLAILGYAHNQGAGGAADYLRTGQVGSDKFHTPGTRYSNLVTAALERVPTRQQSIADIVKRMGIEAAQIARSSDQPPVPSPLAPSIAPAPPPIRDIRPLLEPPPNPPRDRAQPLLALKAPDLLRVGPTDHADRADRPNSVRQDIVAFGKAWKDRFADATRPFVDHLGQMMQTARQPTGTAPALSAPRAPRVDIHIHNETGGNAVMSAAQASAS